MEAERDDTVLPPQVTIGTIPKVGQEFQSVEGALDFYNQYARQAGFSTRIGNNRKDKKTGEEVWKLFVCSKEGKTDETWQNKLAAEGRSRERNRGHTRCGCRARMSIAKSRGKGVWNVSHFIEEHNHALATPSKVHLLKPQRNDSATKKDPTQQFAKANISTCQQVRLLEIDVGGLSSIGCLETDIRNYEMDTRNELRGHDAETLIQHFETEKERNDNFFFAYEKDDAGVFVRCFWADSESRSSYFHFSDAVMFDMTHYTNKCDMKFVPFVGVNHHRQTIVFACGLLSDQKMESFIWLFSKFVEAMPAHISPRVIITDQDAAISRAITEVFPDALHRFCMWHILDKFSEKMNALLYKEHYHKLEHIIQESESGEEFERRWTEIMNSTELGNNEWLSDMYEKRHQWVPAYARHIFDAGMSSSQRVESNHSFFKRYVNHKNSLVDFITRFNRALFHQRHNELDANHIDLNEKPQMTTGFLMEQQMVKIYTKAIFLLFQEELQHSMTYICTLISSTNATRVYTVKHYESEEPFHRQRELRYDTSSGLMSCSCRLFEFEGYPCRHMLCLMKIEQVMLLPDKYIVQRWTKNAKSVTMYEPTPNILEGKSVISRRGALALTAMDLVDECSLTEARSYFLMKEFQNLKRKIKDIDDGAQAG